MKFSCVRVPASLKAADDSNTSRQRTSRDTLDTDRTLQSVGAGTIGGRSCSCSWRRPARRPSLFPATAPPQPPCEWCFEQSTPPVRRRVRTRFLARPDGGGIRAGLVPLGVLLVITSSGLSGLRTQPTPGAAPTISLESTRAVAPAAARGLAVLFDPRRVRPDLGGGTGAAGRRTTRHLAAESRRPRQLRPGTRRPLLGRLRSPARWFPPCRPFRSGTSPTRTTGGRRHFEGPTPPSLADYRQMLDASHPAVKAVNPQMLVVTGGTSPRVPSRWP